MREPAPQPVSARFDRSKLWDYVLLGLRYQDARILDFLYRSEFQFWRMLVDRENQLEVGESGVMIKDKRKEVRVPWREVLNLTFGVRNYSNGVTSEELYLYTRTLGSFCLPIDGFKYDDVDRFKVAVLAWPAYIRKERIRVALGE